MSADNGLDNTDAKGDDVTAMQDVTSLARENSEDDDVSYKQHIHISQLTINTETSHSMESSSTDSKIFTQCLTSEPETDQEQDVRVTTRFGLIWFRKYHVLNINNGVNVNLLEHSTDLKQMLSPVRLSHLLNVWGSWCLHFKIIVYLRIKLVNIRLPGIRNEQ